ncbi:MAG TPA: CRISPR system precrRNA processing endoribonuclease RAMP protein Cas6 [Deltaproteobacteria bacterium]|nr:CRISPR system precrRNA processing endoribonuclease RAMP protein Cas6 [Deltaproteobacteria bacterium]
MVSEGTAPQELPLESFSILPLSLTLKAVTAIKLPAYKGSTFRGAFGAAFKRATCVSKAKSCSECILKERCPYSYVFETPVPITSDRMRKYPYAPHPFVLVPPLEDRRNYSPGEQFEVFLTLICRGIDYLPYFLFAFGEMGKKGIGRGRGKFELVEARTTAGEAVYMDGTVRSPASVRWGDIIDGPPPAELTLKFLTPLRVRYRERLCSDLEFHVLIRSLLRRISLLSFFHCGQELKADFRGFITQAQNVRTVRNHLVWHDWLRYSHRQRAKLKFGGLMGEITFKGDFRPFWPFLRLGEWIHAGKGTSFGLGRYEIVSK